MPKPALYRQWITKNQRAGQPLEATYLVYIYKELLTKAGLTKRYTRKDALAELHEVLADALDGFAGSLPERIKEATKAKLQEDGAADPDGEAPEGTPAQRRASVSRASVSRAQEDEGSLASGSTRSLDKYKGEVQFGDLELRGILLDVGRNPDLGADKDEKAEKDLKDDALQWGVARASRSTKLDGKSLDAFRAAPPASVWLGLVRIGSRVGLDEDKIILVQLAGQAASGPALLASKRTAGEPWHLTALRERFTEHKSAKVKSWNGWEPAELRRDDGKGVRIWETGCYFGFFLVKARDGGPCHYFSFRCASINRYANAGFSDQIPDMPVERMSRDQYAALTGLIQSARGGIALDEEYVNGHFPGVPLKRAAVGVEVSSKKVPLSFRKNVVEEMRKLHF